jgi:hypothetical protein
MSDTSGMLLRAYIDEAGPRCFARDLTPARDAEFGLICALVFEPGAHDRAIKAFTPGFEEFRDAKPPDAKLHITDAFAIGNEAWRPVAEKVREDFLSIILTERPMIVYAARRFKLSRLAHQQEARITAANTPLRSNVAIPGRNRPSDWRIEDDLIQSLALRLDAVVEQTTPVIPATQVDLLFDETDREVAKRYEASINRTKTIEHSTETVQGWDLTKQKKVSGTIEVTIDAGSPLNTTYLGDVHVVGKDHPLVLAADIAANHLYHHLSQLADDAPLNAATSVFGWRLEERVIALVNDASEDCF